MNELGIHPTFLLNQVVGRYETGDLKSVSGQRYENVIEENPGLAGRTHLEGL